MEPPTSEASDAELLARTRGSRAQRDAAFEQIFNSHRANVLAYSFHLTGCRADAEDAVQEVFLAVARGLPSFRGACKLRTWIYRITTRVALRVRMRGRRRRETDLSDDLPAPERQNPAEQRELRTRLTEAIAGLSPEHGTVLALFALDGLSHAEIAEILGVPVGTVWSRWHSARKRLAAELK